MNDELQYKAFKFIHNNWTTKEAPCRGSFSAAEIQEIEQWCIDFNTRRQQRQDRIAFSLEKLAIDVRRGYLTDEDFEYHINRIKEIK